jgi:hypothetical protein
MDITQTPAYRNAFIQYLRKGISIETSLKTEISKRDSGFYVWRTREDDKVRPSHAANDDKVFAWNNPPPTGNPGEDYGCRCHAENIPLDSAVLTEKSKNEVIIHFPDGTSVAKTGGSRAWRNNNPGNIIYSDFARRHGAIGHAGGFSVFPDEATGNAASIALLKTPIYARLSVDEAIARRSPPSENNTARLQRDIHAMSGLRGHEAIGQLNAQQLERLAQAIQRTEGWIIGETVQTKPSP